MHSYLYLSHNNYKVTTSSDKLICNDIMETIGTNRNDVHIPNI